MCLGIAALVSVAALSGPPPEMSVTNLVDVFFNVTLGAPGSCSCQVPKDCDGHQLHVNTTVRYNGATGCDYYAVGGGIDAMGDSAGSAGTPCRTWRADVHQLRSKPTSLLHTPRLASWTLSCA